MLVTVLVKQFWFNILIFFSFWFCSFSIAFFSSFAQSKSTQWCYLFNVSQSIKAIIRSIESSIASPVLQRLQWSHMALQSAELHFSSTSKCSAKSRRLQLNRRQIGDFIKQHTVYKKWVISTAYQLIAVAMAKI